jgi:hypothetical protein
MRVCKETQVKGPTAVLAQPDAKAGGCARTLVTRLGKRAWHEACATLHSKQSQLQLDA